VSVAESPETAASEKKEATVNPTADSNSASRASESSQNSQQKAESLAEQRKLENEQQVISELAARDREVRAHEQAHAAIGGRYAGAPQYTYQRGPDGVSYAVGGEVSIDVSEAATPQETILKMQVVRRAALAPAEPSSQDRRVASRAASIEAQARQDLNVERIDSTDSAQQTEGSSPTDSQSDRESESASSSATSGAIGQSSEASALGQIIDAAQGVSSLGGVINSRA